MGVRGQLAFVVVLLSTLVWADDWTQYRGPSGDGVSAATGVPTQWGADKNIAWKAALPGRGRSSPIVAGNRVWVTTAIETNPRQFRSGPDPVTACEKIQVGLVCLDRQTGKQLYHVELFAVENPQYVHQTNSFATPTPCFEDGLLYCDFGAFGTACVEAETGRALWKKSFVIDHQVGPGSSPAIWKDLLILVRDGRDQQYVIALNKKTGETAWKTNRPPIEAASGNYKKSFGTPVFIDVGGKTQAVIVAAQWIVAYDPATGAEVWRVKHGKGFSVAPKPVFGNGLIYFCTGCNPSQLVAVKVDGQGDVTGTHIAWKASGSVPTMPSPVLVGKELYLVSDGGQLTVFDALTGKQIRMERLGTKVSAAPVLAEGKLFIVGFDAKTVIIKATPDLEKVAENVLSGTVVGSPAILNDGIFLRTDTELFCIRNR